MGAFGKTTQNRRFSVYFCSSLIKIAANPITELFSRIMMLSSDSDRIVKLELAHQLKFISKDLEETVIRKNVFKIVRIKKFK
jgi:hypothetical protein